MLLFKECTRVYCVEQILVFSFKVQINDNFVIVVSSLQYPDTDKTAM